MAQANKMNQVDGKNIEKVIKVPSNTILRVGSTVMKFEVLPIGLIVPLNDTTVPTGWEAFDSANGRLIMGAGGSYAPTTSGGHTLPRSMGNLGGNSTYAGNHTGSANLTHFAGLSSGSGYTSIKELYGPYTRGDHYHSGGNVTLTQIDKNEFKLIRSTVEHDKLPVNAGVFSASSLASHGMSVINANNKMFGANTTTGQTTKAGTVAMSTTGSHNHLGNQSNILANYNGSPSYITSFQDSGNHSSTENLTNISPNHKRLLLSLWASASEQIEAAEGMIAMWESLTPPEGWVLCNGSNGTPDLRDNYIQNCASGSENTTSQGNNQITCGYGGTLTHNVSHTHYNSQYWFSQDMTRKYFYHHTYSWSHNHSFGATNQTFSFLPAYYALSFIMKVE